MQHRTAPNQRLVSGIQNPTRDHLEAVRFERLNAVVGENFRLRVEAQHQRHVGTIHIGIKQTDFVSELGQDNRKIDSERGLSHAAFAGTNGDDSAHTR